MSGGGIGLILVIILFAVLAIAGFVYLIISLIDMWKAYSRNQDQTALLFFIISIIGIFISGSFISYVLAIIFYWNRARGKSWLGIGLILVSIVLAIIGVIALLSFGYDMNNIENMNFDEPMMDQDYDY
ncbi:MULTISPECIES: hypothetical protein [Exiguobacterium]|uniref:DUF4064 domain-containing protein n=2 Tax=Exiguobacterium TaxID=33986 RepID=A0ABX8G8T3_EXIAC|nr:MULTISPECIES: hypothetical protein [Exiguobacterium]AHA30611.1 hypothetical protein U719_13255 [Exiguobacterium sp. MH3]AOT01580.1 hypothetical protein ESP131_15370 [Exiguobacterium sp. U13-1]KSU50142.1 hypothetical protein AS033_01850 [Exiguobacterium enclense]MCQ4089353.1 hypothetical protein [Exiguobacterium sp. LL15]QWB29535.1 hypothetical protein KKI46_13200 [Exiguobacterium acetylicum]